MAVELFIENPAGHRTSENQFQPGARVRIAGRATSVWSIPVPPGEIVDISVRDGEVLTRRVFTNLVGNFWWDVTLPTTLGVYTILATTSIWGNDSLIITITRAAVHMSFEVGVDPVYVFVGGAVKVTVRILADSIPMPGVSVVFFLRLPSGKTVSAANTTNAEGVTYCAWEVSEVGQHWVEVRAEAVDEQRWATFMAYAPDDPTIIPDPTPEPPDTPTPIPTPEPTPGVDMSSMIGAILPIMMIGMIMPMLEEM